MTNVVEVKIYLVSHNLDLSILIELPRLRMPREILDELSLRKEKDQHRVYSCLSNSYPFSAGIFEWSLQYTV
jgi:hypothetical protein